MHIARLLLLLFSSPLHLGRAAEQKESKQYYGCI
uniref:Uncharacterized protein n=1 Tax=Arundo donax TaxID=35708 RepID=A0A0A9BTR4_ARUDO